MEKNFFFFFGQYKRNYTNRKTPQVTGALVISDRDCQQDEGGRGAQAGLGQGWQRGCLLFGLPAVAGFAELPLQNHLPGDAGHLTVGHCVGSVPAEERNCSDPKSRAHTCACRHTYFWRSAPFCRPGWFCLAKKNEVHQWPESCLGSPAETSVSSFPQREEKDKNMI